ncbi:MAG: dimethylarginine dimethylaminohydrolase family protein [Hyphomicrobiales bacterium]
MSESGCIGAHSEYGRLREVVVGIADGLTLPPFSKELGHYNDELRQALEAANGNPLPIEEAFPERFEQTREQMENVAAVYERHGVTVHRVRSFTEAEAGNLSSLQRGHAQLYPADPVFVLGNHFIEISIRRAYRRKEIFPLRELILPMIDEDPDAHYVAMPQAAPHDPPDEGPGPFLEGGDILIEGNDIFVGMGELCSNKAGIDWLTRYIEPFGYKVHPMPIKGPVLHALGIMCLLRKGLLMAHLPALEDGLPEPLRDWDVIEISREEMDAHATVGVSLDDKHYMIDPRFNRVMNELVRSGVEPVPTPCDAIGFWGGAIRCITLPIRRDAA